MTLISVILLKMFLTKLDSENIIVMSPSPGIVSHSTDCDGNVGKCKPLMISGSRSRLWITGLHWSANFWSSKDITLFQKNVKLQKIRGKRSEN